MYDVKPVTSKGELDCGPACLKMLLDWYGIDVPLDQLTEECGVKLDGCSAADLLRVGRAHGLDMTAWRMDADEVARQDRPSIVWWRYQHFCVCCGSADDGRVAICNPSRGRYRMGADTFASLYSGVVLFAGEPADRGAEDNVDAGALFTWGGVMWRAIVSIARGERIVPGSNAESAFTYVPTVAGPNNIKLHNSQYVTPDRIVANATIHDKSGNHYSLIYETWRGGYCESYLLANDMNGDGYNYDAVYVPTDGQASYYENGAVQGSGQFRFASKDDMDRFMQYVHNDGYLKNHQGEYAEGYSVYSPWVHRIDFGYKHDFKVNLGRTMHRLQLSLDVKNLLNLFNSAWGVSKYMNPELNSGRILKYESTDAQGYAVFSTPKAVSGNTKTWIPYHTIGQCWYASIGIKYMFN